MSSTYRVKMLRSLTASLLLAFLLTSLGVSQEALPGNNPDPMDWVFVIDTSKSMVGKGDGNVFPQVKETLKEFIKMAKNDDTVIIYTFDETPRFIHKVQVKGEKDRNELVEAVFNLSAEGNWTHTGEAVEKALDRIKELQEEYKGQNHETSLVLFTDGKEDHARNSNSIFLKDIPTAKIKGVSPYTFVVWLNKEKPPVELTDFADNFENGHVIQYSTPSEIPKAIDDVFFRLPPQIRMHPTSIDIGKIEPGDAAEATVYVTSNRKTSLRVTLQGAGGGVSLAEPQGVITLEGEKEVAIPVRLQPPAEIPDGHYEGSVIFTVDEARSRGGVPREEHKDGEAFTVNYRLQVERVPITWKIIVWSAVTLGILLLSYIILYFALGGRNPWVAFRDRFNLEGEIAVLWPETAYGSGSIKLQDENARRVRLSSLQTGRFQELLDGSDAELMTVYEDGKKMVGIESLQGTLRVQDRDVVSERLYNNDVIEIGGLKLRYDGLSERPDVSDRVEYIEAGI